MGALEPAMTRLRQLEIELRISNPEFTTHRERIFFGWGIGVCVCVSVCWASCAKTAEPIQMLLGAELG